jgi:hypothetical protein
VGTRRAVGRGRVGMVVEMRWDEIPDEGRFLDLLLEEVLFVEK